jgi:TPR repeat protein
MYYSGLGVEKDRQPALMYYKLAADQDFTYALVALGSLDFD